MLDCVLWLKFMSFVDSGQFLLWITFQHLRVGFSHLLRLLLMGLFELIQVIDSELFPIDVDGKVLELFVYLLVIQQFLGKQPVLLWVFDLINLDELFFLLAFVYLDGDTIDLLLVLLHLDDLVQVFSLLLLATLQVKIEIAFGLLTPVCLWHHIQSFFDSLDVGLLMEFYLLWVKLCQSFLIFEQSDIDFYCLLFDLPVFLLCFDVGRQPACKDMYLLQLRFKRAFFNDCQRLCLLSSIYCIFCWINFCFWSLRNSFSSSSSCCLRKIMDYFCLDFLVYIYCFRILSYSRYLSHCFSLCTNSFLMTAYQTLCYYGVMILGSQVQLFWDFSLGFGGLALDQSIFCSFLIMPGSRSKNYEMNGSFSILYTFFAYTGYSRCYGAFASLLFSSYFAGMYGGYIEDVSMQLKLLQIRVNQGQATGACDFSNLQSSLVALDVQVMNISWQSFHFFYCYVERPAGCEQKQDQSRMREWLMEGQLLYL